VAGADFLRDGMEIRGSKSSELEEAAELQRLVFRPKEDAFERYLTYVRDDPSYQPDQTRVVIAEGKMVGHLRIWDRLIQVRGARIRAGGIGSVLIHPDYRGRGWAHDLMRDAESYMASAGYDVGLLFTIIGTPFYAAQGWTPIHLPTFEFALGDDLKGRAADSVRALDIERDLDQVAKIYDTYSRDLTGSEIRSRDYWTSGPSRIRGVFPGWGVDRDGKLLGYVNFVEEADHIWVRETCALGGNEDVFQKLAEKVAAVASELNVAKISGSLLRSHPFVKELSRLLNTKPAWDTHDEMMLKLIDWRSLKQKLGGTGAPEQSPEDEGPLWRGLFGEDSEEEEIGEWIVPLPTCVGPFYWWTDIF